MLCCRAYQEIGFGIIECSFTELPIYSRFPISRIYLFEITLPLSTLSVIVTVTPTVQYLTIGALLM